MKANSEDPDQTPRSAASDLCLHCLPMSNKKDTRLICVKSINLLGRDLGQQIPPVKGLIGSVTHSYRLPPIKGHGRLIPQE